MIVCGRQARHTVISVKDSSILNCGLRLRCVLVVMLSDLYQVVVKNLRSREAIPSGSQESPTDLDDGNLGPTVTFQVCTQSRLAPPVASCTRYGDRACSYDRTKVTSQN